MSPSFAPRGSPGLAGCFFTSHEAAVTREKASVSHFVNTTVEQILL